MATEALRLALFGDSWVELLYDTSTRKVTGLRGVNTTTTHTLIGNLAKGGQNWKGKIAGPGETMTKAVSSVLSNRIGTYTEAISEGGLPYIYWDIAVGFGCLPSTAPEAQ